MSKLKNENYIVIQAWMVNELGLKGNDLLIYAIIYGFSQDNENEFKASAKYLSYWTGIDRRNVFTHLNKLIENNYINKSENTINNVKFVSYSVNHSILRGGDAGITTSDKTSYPYDKTSPNNKSNNKDRFSSFNNNKLLVEKEKEKEKEKKEKEKREKENEKEKEKKEKEKREKENEKEKEEKNKEKKICYKEIENNFWVYDEKGLIEKIEKDKEQMVENCEAIKEKARKYMQDKYGFVPDIERGENIKYIFENIKAKSQKDIAHDLGLYASQVSKIITKYGGEKYGRT